MTKKINLEPAYSLAKGVALRFGRVFVAAFVAQIGIEAATHSLAELTSLEGALQVLIVPSIAAGLAALSKYLREKQPETFSKLPI